MYLSDNTIQPQFIYMGAALFGVVLIAAVRYAPWHKLFARGNSNIYFGTLVGLLFLWMMGTRFEIDAVFHLSAMTSLTLMFGWQFAVIGGSALLGIVFVIRQIDLLVYFPSVVAGVLVPVLVTWMVLMFVRALLPKHFFIYIFFNAFFTGGLVAVCSATVIASLLLLSGMPFDQLWNRFVIWFPLMIFPEAVLNGWIMTVLVGLKPQWVATFRDDEYLKGK